MRRVFARRLGQFGLDDGTLAARVATDWVLIDARGALTRVPAIFSEMFGVGDASFSIGRVSLPATPASAERRRLTVRPHELDPMAHANNAVYLDWLEETVAASGGAEDLARVPRRYRLEYALAAEAGEALEAAAWADAGGWSFRLTRTATVLRRTFFRAALDIRAGAAATEARE
jgi:acyl-ACP thioesterase